MAVKIGINGYGRIGRNVMRALYESGRTSELQIVALNDLGDAETNAHLTRFDTAHGKFPGEVKVEGGDLVVNGDRDRFGVPDGAGVDLAVRPGEGHDLSRDPDAVAGIVLGWLRRHGWAG